MTIRLYLQDAYCRTVDAQVVAARPVEGGYEIALDRTCFYPNGGGQPADRGTLAGMPVQDVRESEGQVWHLLPQQSDRKDAVGAPHAEPLPAIGTTVHGELDWMRRFDHMQQHSGQHILSATALEELGAQTLSFHLGTEAVTIDLDLRELSPAQVEMLEDRANSAVLANLPVSTYEVAPEEVAHLNLRKPPTKGEHIRIVEIEGLDRSPCGGTHVRHTGEIGCIKIRKQERYKGGTRVEFVCGWRALADYRWKHQTITNLARDLSVADRETEVAVRRALASAKELGRELGHLRQQLLSHEARALCQRAITVGSVQVVAQSFSERSAAEIRSLAAAIAAQPGMVAILASLTPETRLFFQRSSDVAADMRQLLRQVTERVGGGGGGRPEAAEAGGIAAERVAEALAWAIGALGTRLT